MSFDKDNQLERDGAYDMGWEFEPEFEPPPAGEIAQLQLLEDEQFASEWRLDQRTREVGKAGVRRTIETWKRARRT